jgi:predicted metalloprotease
MTRVRQALRRMDAAREEWWLVRRDSDPDGIWYAVLSPKREWDWAYKVGRAKWLAKARVTRARKESRTGRKLEEIRRLVDMIRTSSGSSAVGPGA